MNPKVTTDNHPHEDELPAGWPEEKLPVSPDPDNMGISPFAMLEELRKHKPEPSEHSDI
ncbi:MAG: hypothetical protein UU10_C0011G0003 [Parcubacteria group bacterium GW2011_GWF1_40_6]|uniref:Uncharacterized protein n=1 Tax=Candidatus Nomurabacteria bacterium GW2011_GWF2_40_12 TaxID=1618776 RepID=A0A0G0T9R9_9BACT|nr:MAG: hypothetical protein UT78_C0001G0001 [Candidatus Nomurabacteria bacterium GW2011_GWF2_40_12]KKR69556.1 MAG: hypothetical protein UU10_C0011G0003 [Parcubacteria group bacterium GW2011_GWF1_40_6]